VTLNARCDTSPVQIPASLIVAVASAAPLTPLNSTMIAVGLVSIRDSFHVSLTATTWLISSFYLASAVGQPAMGLLADRLGAKPVFCGGMVIAAIAGALTPLSPNFGWMIGYRMLLALGTSASYPAGMVALRDACGDSRLPSRALSIISMTFAGSAALGPVLGGALISWFGWQAIFLVNVPVAAIGFLMGLFWLPPTARDRQAPVQSFDIFGILTFAGAMSLLLIFLMSLPHPFWLLVPITLPLWVLFIIAERRAKDAFIDIRMLAANPRLTGVLIQFIGTNVVFYAVYYGLPAWLEQVRGYEAEESGLVLLPTAVLGVLTTPIAARLVSRNGPRDAVAIGAVLLAAGSFLLLLLDADTALLSILLITMVSGLPNGFNNFGLQAAMYVEAPEGGMGIASGLFQTSRYVGAIVSAAIVGIVYGDRVSNQGFHLVALIIGLVSLVLVIASATLGRREVHVRQ
jgi:MFS family permease